MEDPNTGVHSPAEPTASGVQPAQEPTQNNPQQEPNNPTPDTRLQELETQLQAERTRAQNLEQLARQQQSRADQYRQQVQALAGTTPQADPIESKAALYAKKFNLNPEDAKAVVAMIKDEIAPFQQQYQQQANALQASTMVGDVMNQAYQADPSLFSEATWNEVQNQLRQDALQGNSQFMNVDYALDLAAIAQRRARTANPNNPMLNSHPYPGNPPQQYPQRQQANIPSMLGTSSQFRPAVQQTSQKQHNPQVDSLAKQMAQHIGIPEQYLNPNNK